MIAEIKNEIIRLKKEKNICILAHCYENRDVVEIADFVGDSFALAKKAAVCDSDIVIMCGVRFMAEGVKLLAPEKTVILSAPDAGCPMADQFNGEDVRAFRRTNPEYAVVAYINTTADIKKECDVCVTSASAIKIVKNMPEKDILFIPDCNLGAYVAANVPEKNIVLWKGGCPVHNAITGDEAKAAKAAHPEALLLVHPECDPAVSAEADFLGSTTEIMDFAKKSDKTEFIIGTENSIVEHLKHECAGSGKKFYPLSKRLICADMKLTTLVDVLNCCTGEGGEVIEIDADTAEKAVKCLNRMIELG